MAVREGNALQRVHEVVEHLFCGYLATLTISNVRLGAEGARAGVRVGATRCLASAFRPFHLRSGKAPPLINAYVCTDELGGARGGGKGGGRGGRGRRLEREKQTVVGSASRASSVASREAAEGAGCKGRRLGEALRGGEGGGGGGGGRRVA